MIWLKIKKNAIIIVWVSSIIENTIIGIFNTIQMIYNKIIPYLNYFIECFKLLVSHR